MNFYLIFLQFGINKLVKSFFMLLISFLFEKYLQYNLKVLLSIVSSIECDINKIWKMSSYIIAGSADSLDTAYCQELARKIKAKYRNIDFRIVIKHPKEWEDYLNQICRIYGFLTKSNPIIYTYHGKIIGNKDAFVSNAVKYFGLEPEDLNIPSLTNKINIKLAEEELQKKNIQRNNIKTLPQKIDATYAKLLKNGILKHQYKNKEQFLVNGVEYYVREVEGLCSTKKFVQMQEVAIEKQIIEPENIDLMALSQQDQIHPEDGGKDGLITNVNQVLNTESMEKMSEASRTNRIQSSVMSRDGDSKHNKDSGQNKQQIVEEFDDVADYNDHNMEDLCICELGDNFFLSFEKEKNTHIPAEMLIYHNETQNGSNCLRVYNDGRAVIGHRTLIKEIHYMHDEIEVENSMQEMEGEGEGDEAANNEQKKNNEESLKEGEESSANKQAEGQENEEKKENEKDKVEKRENEDAALKSKTEPNIPHNNVGKNQQKVEEIISEPDSDLNLVSNLNYHTLYIHRPLSSNQLKMILYTIRETNTVACLQFLPENPNPKIKVYNRHNLMEIKDALFPVQKFINKQNQDGEVEELELAVDQHRPEESEKIIVHRINGLEFNHFYYPHNQGINDELLGRALKVLIDELLNLEEKLHKEIGYNIIFAKEYTMLVALTEPYKVYGGTSLYFDGLAYLGYVHLANVVEGYMLKPSSQNKSKVIPQLLAHCSGFQRDD